MNLKSYMRGIGAGLIVAALLMGISQPARVPESKVDKTTLLEASVSQNATEEVKVSVDIEGKKEDVISEKPDENESQTIPGLIVKEDTKQDTEETKEEIIEELPEPEPTPDSTEQTPPSIDPMPENDTGFVTEGDVVEIRVIKGDSSVSVSRRLYEAGLVESAVEFDKYLCANKYDKFICVGTYDIQEGSDFETIAKIITKRK